MPDLADGESVPMQGSGSKPYILKNVGGVYSCTCPAWRNQSTAIERRTCKHLRKLRGDAAEEARVGQPAPAPAKAAAEDKAGPPLLLAETWDNVTDLTGWWMSEKLDGVRAYWDGAQFLSRQGNRYHAPDWFTAGLPDEPLDGELWLGRKKFQRTVEHRSPTGQKRSLEGAALRRLRCTGAGRRLRGAAGVPARLRQTARPAVCRGPRP